jgi:hypothetical protein
VAAVAALAVNVLPASAATDPYLSGSTGYDVSYPNCGATPGGAFAVVGVNHGRPFTANTCVGTEYSAAPQSPLPSLYMNAAYSGAYRRNITSGCSAQSGGNQAWAIGCSEAETSLGYAGGRSASMWWIDVETGNSWSTSNLASNQATIQGAVDRLNQTGLPVGVYSTASMWRTITGGSFTPAGLAADWVAAGSCATPFTSSPVWLTQATTGGVDVDTAC